MTEPKNKWRRTIKAAKVAGVVFMAFLMLLGFIVFAELTVDIVTGRDYSPDVIIELENQIGPNPYAEPDYAEGYDYGRGDYDQGQEYERPRQRRRGPSRWDKEPENDGWR